MGVTLPCPTCRKPAAIGSADFPFCSERCRLIDLGRWADEEYRIPAVDEEPGAEEEPAAMPEDAPEEKLE